MNLWFVQLVDSQCQWFTMVLNQMNACLRLKRVSKVNISLFTVRLRTLPAAV